MDSSPFAIVIRPVARADLQAIRMFERRRIAEAIESSLVYAPFVQTRNRKPLPGVVPAFEHEPPLWELRVGEYRVFYDGIVENQMVFIRAVRHKPPGKTTEEITR